jgi:N-acetylglucosaminyl-diphospho-decaprenol L-rhamnosyltransferase
MAAQAREGATASIIAGRLGGPHPDPPPRAEEAAVDVVIVNWNSQSFLRECVAALDAGAAADTLKVTVVDNASSDGSPDGLGAGRLRVDVVHNNENRGFAAACNQGARLGSARYLLFLNPDVRRRL